MPDPVIVSIVSVVLCVVSLGLLAKTIKRKSQDPWDAIIQNRARWQRTLDGTFTISTGPQAADDLLNDDPGSWLVSGPAGDPGLDGLLSRMDAIIDTRMSTMGHVPPSPRPRPPQGSGGRTAAATPPPELPPPPPSPPVEHRRRIEL